MMSSISNIQPARLSEKLRSSCALCILFQTFQGVAQINCIRRFTCSASSSVTLSITLSSSSAWMKSVGNNSHDKHISSQIFLNNFLIMVLFKLT